MKRIMLCLAVLAMLIAPLLARASGIYVNLMAENDAGRRVYFKSMCVFEGEAYFLSTIGGIYRLNVADAAQVDLVPFTMAQHDPETLSAEYRRMLDLDTKNLIRVDLNARQEAAVKLSYIMSDGERLFGLNSESGIFYTLVKAESNELTGAPTLCLDWTELGCSWFENIYTQVNGYAST